jgi:hypothetical protein
LGIDFHNTNYRIFICSTNDIGTRCGTGSCSRRISSAESSTRHIGETTTGPGRAGEPSRYDCAYMRNGTANLFVFFEAPRSWRKVNLTERRAADDTTPPGTPVGPTGPKSKSACCDMTEVAAWEQLHNASGVASTWMFATETAGEQLPSVAGTDDRQAVIRRLGAVPEVAVGIAARDVDVALAKVFGDRQHRGAVIGQHRRVRVPQPVRGCLANRVSLPGFAEGAISGSPARNPWRTEPGPRRLGRWRAPRYARGPDKEAAALFLRP